ncbi:MAG TPA: hypothetical protein VF329_14910 [Gammaproteobacteria bacterium]
MSSARHEIRTRKRRDLHVPLSFVLQVVLIGAVIPALQYGVPALTSLSI